MPFVAYADRVKETTTTTGTGALTLAGAATNFITFNTGVGVGNQCFYTIEDNGNSAWEVGIGTLTNSTTLSRDTILASSNANAVVTLAAGTKNIWCDYPAKTALMTPPLGLVAAMQQPGNYMAGFR
jgi:hypothetical protein